VVEALGRIGDRRASARLLMILHCETWEVWQQTIQVLGTLRSPSTLTLLLVALGDGKAEVRETAGQAICALGVLRGRPWKARQQAARTLGALGDSRAREPLFTTLDDVDENVRLASALALAALADPRALKPLLATLGNTHWGFRSRRSGVSSHWMTPPHSNRYSPA
jgi:HEAT repeat protein